MLFLSYLLMFKISKIPTTLKNQKLEVILDLISNPNAETSLSSIQYGRDYFYDLLYCHRLECLQQKYRFWTQHKLTKTINTPEGKILVPFFYSHKIFTDVSITIIAFLLAFYYLIQVNKEKKLFRLLTEHSTFKSFYHDLQVILSRLSFYQELDHLKQELDRFKNKERIVFFKSKSISKIAQDVALEFQEKVTFRIHEIENDIVYFEGCFYRAFRNLIKNAVEAGASEISLSIKKKNNHLEVKLVDNGFGFSPKVLKSIESKSNSSKKDGLGIALFSLKRDLSNSNGFLKIENLDKQTTIKINLKSFSNSMLVHLEDDQVINQMWKIQERVNQFQCFHFENHDKEFKRFLNKSHSHFQFLFLDKTIQGKQLGDRFVASLRKANRKIFFTSGIHQKDAEHLGKIITII